MQPIIAVASGKGGTGKTTFAVNLASSLEDNVVYFDADVEEPNGHIYFKPKITSEKDVLVMIPEVNSNLCTGCGQCSKVCKFNALIVLKSDLIVFPELCHGCGSCIIACSHNALREGSRAIGKVNMGSAGRIGFIEGRLREGEAKAPPVIKALHPLLTKEKIQVIDVSPGTSCPVIEGVRKSDFVVLVTEPTSFGLHDLDLAIKMVKRLGLPHGVVINRADAGNMEVETFCDQQNIPVLMRIPFDKKIFYLCSQGEILVSHVPGLKKAFIDCYTKIKTILKRRGFKHEGN